MNRNYILDDASEAMQVLFLSLLVDGAIVPSRAGQTRELSHIGITLRKPLQRELLVLERKASIAAQIFETMWVISGKNDMESLVRYLPRATQFSDDGVTWRAGYGQRLRRWEGHPHNDGHDCHITTDQLAYVVGQLRGNPDTRQAVMTIWDPTVDTLPGKDIACNNWLHFLARHGRLHLMVGIRSNDAMWGWSGINQFEWSVLLEIVAGLCNLQVGEMHFAVGSFHLYEDHWEKAHKVAYAPKPLPVAADSPRFDAKTFGNEFAAFDDLCQKWFRIEYDIRTGSPLADAYVEEFPEPMLRSWLRVLQWWWSGNPTYLKHIAGTRLDRACQLSVQPKVQRKPNVLKNLLLLVQDEIPGGMPSDKEINSWSEGQALQVQDWASLVHLSASDNPVEVPPRPPFLGTAPIAVHVGTINPIAAGGERVDSHSTPEGRKFTAYVTELHNEKHKAYGDSWRRRGEMLGIMANIARKIDRLDAGTDTPDESQTDTAIDLLVYLAKYRTWLGDFDDNPEHANNIIRELERQDHRGYSVSRSEAWLTEAFETLEHYVTAVPEERLNQVDRMLPVAYRLAFRRWKGVEDDLGFVGGDYDLP